MALQEAPDSIDITVKILWNFVETFSFWEHLGYVCWKLFIICAHSILLYFQDIEFKLHSKYQLFNINASTPNFNGIDLLATASTFGLVIVGRPSSQEIQGLTQIF